MLLRQIHIQIYQLDLQLAARGEKKRKSYINNSQYNTICQWQWYCHAKTAQ